MELFDSPSSVSVGRRLMGNVGYNLKVGERHTGSPESMKKKTTTIIFWADIVYQVHVKPGEARTVRPGVQPGKLPPPLNPAKQGLTLVT